MTEDNLIWLMIGILIGWFSCIWFGRMVDNNLKELAENIGAEVKDRVTALQQANTQDEPTELTGD